MKSHQIRAQDPAQELVSPGQDSKHVRRGPRDVEKEADPRPRQNLAEHAGNQRQLVIVDPDQVAVLILGSDRFSEALIDAPVGGPAVFRFELHLVEQVVEERPEDAVGKSVVVLCNLGRSEKHRHHAPLATGRGRPSFGILHSR